MTEDKQKRFLLEGLQQVAEWAEAYVDNETGIHEARDEHLSTREKMGLALIGMIKDIKL